jgi:hypothetical protein
VQGAARPGQGVKVIEAKGQRRHEDCEAAGQSGRFAVDFAPARFIQEAAAEAEPLPETERPETRKAARAAQRIRVGLGCVKGVLIMCEFRSGESLQGIGIRIKMRTVQNA